jgi:hypothetical protein
MPQRFTGDTGLVKLAQARRSAGSVRTNPSYRDGTEGIAANVRWNARFARRTGDLEQIAPGQRVRGPQWPQLQRRHSPDRRAGRDGY